jgi:hypothetical protein
MSSDENGPQLPKDFFKQFKDKEQFHSFFNSLFKRIRPVKCILEQAMRVVIFSGLIVITLDRYWIDRLPVLWQQFLYFIDRMSRQSLQHVLQPNEGIDAIELAGS